MRFLVNRSDLVLFWCGGVGTSQRVNPAPEKGPTPPHQKNWQQQLSEGSHAPLTKTTPKQTKPTISHLPMPHNEHLADYYTVNGLAGAYALALRSPSPIPFQPLPTYRRGPDEPHLPRRPGHPPSESQASFNPYAPSPTLSPDAFRLRGSQVPECLRPSAQQGPEDEEDRFGDAETLVDSEGSDEDDGRELEIADSQSQAGLLRPMGPPPPRTPLPLPAGAPPRTPLPPALINRNIELAASLAQTLAPPQQQSPLTRSPARSRRLRQTTPRQEEVSTELYGPEILRLRQTTPRQEEGSTTPARELYGPEILLRIGNRDFSDFRSSGVVPETPAHDWSGFDDDDDDDENDEANRMAAEALAILSQHRVPGEEVDEALGLLDQIGEPAPAPAPRSVPSNRRRRLDVQEALAPLDEIEEPVRASTPDIQTRARRSPSSVNSIGLPVLRVRSISPLARVQMANGRRIIAPIPRLPQRQRRAATIPSRSATPDVADQAFIESEAEGQRTPTQRHTSPPSPRSEDGPTMISSPPEYDNGRSSPTLGFRIFRMPGDEKRFSKWEKEGLGDQMGQPYNRQHIDDACCKTFTVVADYPEGISGNYLGHYTGSYPILKMSEAKRLLGYTFTGHPTLVAPAEVVYRAFLQDINARLVVEEIRAKSEDREAWDFMLLTMAKSKNLPPRVRKYLIDGPRDADSHTLLWHQHRRAYMNAIDSICQQQAKTLRKNSSGLNAAKNLLSNSRRRDWNCS